MHALALIYFTGSSVSSDGAGAHSRWRHVEVHYPLIPQIRLLQQIDSIKKIWISPLTFCWQDFRTFCGWVRDHLFWWKRLLHLLQQSAMAQPLPVCLQAPGPGPGPASWRPASVPNVSIDADSWLINDQFKSFKVFFIYFFFLSVLNGRTDQFYCWRLIDCIWSQVPLGLHPRSFWWFRVGGEAPGDSPERV